MGLDKDTLSGVLITGIKTIRSREGSAQFLEMCTDLDNLNNKAINKKGFKREISTVI